LRNPDVAVNKSNPKQFKPKQEFEKQETKRRRRKEEHAL
jgi:hypothetical protein